MQHTSIHPIPEPSCRNCAYSLWAVALGFGHSCGNAEKVAEERAKAEATGALVGMLSASQPRFLIPSSTYVCEHHELHWHKVRLRLPEVRLLHNAMEAGTLQGADLSRWNSVSDGVKLYLAHQHRLAEAFDLFIATTGRELVRMSEQINDDRAAVRNEFPKGQRDSSGYVKRIKANHQQKRKLRLEAWQIMRQWVCDQLGVETDVSDTWDILYELCTRAKQPELKKFL